MMDGEIWVESREGQGSTFGFRLRLPRAELEEAAPPRLPPGLRRAVVVDDQPANREIVARHLTQLGMEVTICASGAEALAAVGDGTDLVVSDHNMPEMDGLELVEALRQGGGRAVPFLLMSSNAGMARNDPAFRHVSGVLQKPFARAELFARLAEIEMPDGANARAETAAPPEAPAPGAGPPADGTAPQTRPMRVLAAEDNKTNQLVLRKMLKDLEIDLHFAANGEEAVALYQDVTPDLVFMDISMPGMDGREATREIRRLEEGGGRRVPIVALTAYAMSGDAEAILAAGLDRFMTKPLRKSLLHEVILEHATPEMRPPRRAAPAQPSAGRTKTG